MRSAWRSKIGIAHLSVLMARTALFVIYFWFGLLKVVGQSPASEMIHTLFLKTLAPVLPFLPSGTFLVLFGLFEMLIGILFIIPGMEWSALVLFFLHMIMTTLPLFIMPEVWMHAFVPTLEGQYIVKNLALIACALSVWGAIVPKNVLLASTKTLESDTIIV